MMWPSSFYRRVICIYDCSGWANMMEKHTHRIGTYIHVFEPYVARSALRFYPYANLIWLHIALWGYFWEHPGRLVPAYCLVLVNVWAELCIRRSPPSPTRSLSLSLSLSTHLSSNKKIVNYKQRALSSIGIPQGLLPAYISAPPSQRYD